MLSLNVPLTTIINKLLLIRNSIQWYFTCKECNIRRHSGWMDCTSRSPEAKFYFILSWFPREGGGESVYRNISSTDDNAVLNNPMCANLNNEDNMDVVEWSWCLKIQKTIQWPKEKRQTDIH